MFHLTRGVLKDIVSRGLITEELSESQERSDLTGKENKMILLRNYENPPMVKVTKLVYHKEVGLILLELFDGDTYQECALHDQLTPFLSNEMHLEFFDKENLDPIRDEKRLFTGVIIIMSEISFMDVFLDKKIKRDKMLVLHNYSVVGFDYAWAKENDEKFNSYKINTIDINLNNMNWSVKAKLLKMSVLKEFCNKITNQDGKVMRLQFTDETGIIELVAFNKEIDKVKSLIENRVYNINKADVKVAKGNYSAFQESSECMLELVVNKKTSIIESICDASTFKTFKKAKDIDVLETGIKKEQSKYKDFLRLEDLRSKKDGQIVSVIGVVSKVDDIKEITPKYKEPINLKNFYITDKSGLVVKVSLWGAQAETNVNIGNIFMLSKVKIVTYQGVSLSVQRDSFFGKIEDNMDSFITELRKWWDNKNIDDLSQSLKRTSTFDKEDFKKVKSNAE
jgi:hypothetical protein